MDDFRSFPPVFPSCYCRFASTGQRFVAAVRPTHVVLSELSPKLLLSLFPRDFKDRRRKSVLQFRYFFKSKVLYECLQTSNMRRYDSLDPRLNVLESPSSMRFASLSHPIKINEKITERS